MAERKEKSQLIGEFLREAAVLVAVAWPLEHAITHEGQVDVERFFLAIGCGVWLLCVGIALEGRDEV
jgi:hypothetical protein